MFLDQQNKFYKTYFPLDIDCLTNCAHIRTGINEDLDEIYGI